MSDPRMTPTNDAPVTVEQCPFCGGEPRACPDTGYASAIVFCPDSNDCPVHPSADADLAIGETLADATRRWNTRHRLAALASAPAGDGVEAELRGALVVAKRAIIQAAKDTLWCDDSPAETVVDRIAAALARPRTAVGERVKPEPQAWGDIECSGCTLPRRDCECN